MNFAGRFAALDQRIGLRFHLDGLGLDETADSIGHNLSLAGRTDTLFLRRRHRADPHHLPRDPPAINNLSVQALIATYADSKSHRRRVSRPCHEHRSHGRVMHDPLDLRPVTDHYTADVLADTLATLAWLRGLGHDDPAIRLHPLASVRDQPHAEILHTTAATNDRGYDPTVVVVIVDLPG